MFSLPPPTVTPTEHAGKWTFSFGDTTLVVEAERGARISSLRLGSDEVLTGPEVNAANWGSSLWPSPESLWGWPPPSEIDTEPYRACVVERRLELTGPTVRSGGVAGLAMTKRLWANAEQGFVCLEYELVNRGSSPCAVAAWEVTRVPRDNLHFFPEGGSGRVKKSHEVLPLRSEGGIAWLEYDLGVMDRDRLVGCDGAEGWMASVRGDLLFAKVFEEVPVERVAPGEAEVLLFSSGASAYVELEAQSAYERLAPGESLRWPVLWMVRRLPAALEVRAGNLALVDFVRRALPAG
jgi:hypothetical protein